MDRIDKEKGGVQSVEQSGRILAALCDFRYPVPLKEVAAASGMPAAKAHRYLTSLIRIGLAEQDTQSGCYGIGPLALRLGIAAMERNDIVTKSGQLLANMAREMRTSGHLAIWGERGPVLVRTEHGGPPIISTLGVGAVMPLLRSATGRAFMAFLPPEATETLVLFEQDVLGMPDSEIRAISADTRARGYAQISGGLIPGLSAIACPMFGIDDQIQCCVTLVSTDPNFLDPDRGGHQRAAAMIRAANERWLGRA